MSLQNNLQYAVMIKDEYLPPPLEKNYLSLFDIQVKMAKEFLQGTEEQKVAIIKKRIKKFFDYGNQETNQEEITFEGSNKNKSQYPPFQINSKSINKNLEIDPSKIILYGRELATFDIAQKIFPGFIGFEKIDDCNVKLSFSNKKQCQKLLLQMVKCRSSIVTDHIKDPYEIEWFELQSYSQGQNKPELSFYARFVTNKDDILFSNDNYFRKLLGKARQMVDKKEQQMQLRQKEIEEKAQRRKSRYEYKRRFISMDYGESFQHNYGLKKYKKDYDQVTNYDGDYNGRSKRGYQNSRESCYYESREEPLSFYRRNSHKEMKYFENLNVSQIRPVPIQLQEKSSRNKSFKHKDYRHLSRDSSPCFQRFDKKSIDKKSRRKSREPSPREKLIQAHRKKSQSRSKGREKQLSSYDYDQEMSRVISKSRKPRFEID